MNHSKLAALAVFSAIVPQSALGSAQSPPDEAPVTPVPVDAPMPAPDASAAAAPKPADDAAAEPMDEVRLRGGFSLNAGVLFVPDNESEIGGVVGAALRLGVQFNHTFSLYYQNTPFVTLIVNPAEESLAGGFIDYNTVLFGLTFFDALDIGLGGSLDAVWMTICSVGSVPGPVPGVSIPNPGCDPESHFAPGAHARLAFELGSSPTPDSARRSAFSIGFDVHPSFVVGGDATIALLTATAGIGGEWF